nr:hypothetical protein [Tanacetum cinerariifolium]GEZ62692.1 hypothetical protein [Tanacetum cinerariifolium]
MFSKEAKKESTKSDSNSDDETHVTGFMVEPSTIKKLKKFDFITEDGRHIHLTKEEINHQKKLEKDAKAKAAKQEGEDPLDKLNDLANKKKKHADDIHDYFKANKRLKSSVNLDIAEVDKRNLNPLKKMRTIKQLSSLGPLKIRKYLYFSLCSGTETKEGLWKELQFSLVDNFKLNVVYLLNRILKRLFHF